MTVVVVDDSADFRHRVRRLLSADPAFEVLGEAQDGAEGLRELARLAPDVVLLDLHMPILDGFSVLVAVEHRAQPLKVIVVTHDPSPQTVRRCRELQVHAIVDKMHISTVLVPTLQRIAASIGRGAA